MADDDLTAETCRQRAKECREMGLKERTPEVRKQFEGLAVAWEQLCEEIEKRAKPQGH
jgi:hypothetical protein